MVITTSGWSLDDHAKPAGDHHSSFSPPWWWLTASWSPWWCRNGGRCCRCMTCSPPSELRHNFNF
jgi:hypothetical protein